MQVLTTKGTLTSPILTGTLSISCLDWQQTAGSPVFLTQPCCRPCVGAQLRVKSLSPPPNQLYSSLHPTNSPWAPSALLDDDIRSLELPNGGQWPRLMVPGLSQRHRRLPRWLPTIQLGWAIGCGWGVGVKPNMEDPGMCAHTADGAGERRVSVLRATIKKWFCRLHSEKRVRRKPTVSWKKKRKTHRKNNKATSYLKYRKNPENSRRKFLKKIYRVLFIWYSGATVTIQLKHETVLATFHNWNANCVACFQSTYM